MIPGGKKGTAAVEVAVAELKAAVMKELSSTKPHIPSRMQMGSDQKENIYLACSSFVWPAINHHVPWEMSVQAQPGLPSFWKIHFLTQRKL